MFHRDFYKQACMREILKRRGLGGAEPFPLSAVRRPGGGGWARKAGRRETQEEASVVIFLPPEGPCGWRGEGTSNTGPELRSGLASGGLGAAGDSPRAPTSLWHGGAHISFSLSPFPLPRCCCCCFSSLG